MPCMCGDTECPSCGTAQGTYRPPVIRARRRQSRMPNAQEIQAAVRARIEHLSPTLALYANATEPQQVEIRNYTSGQIGALRDVLNMITNRRRSLL
jgi:hypothetical protein